VPLLEQRPELYDDLKDVWRAFIELNEVRAFGPIAFTEIRAWLWLHRFVGDKEEFAYLIRALDRAYMKWQREHGKDEPNS